MYESFYGLTGKPFQLNPDPAFYFGSRGHKRAFAYLQYGVYQSEGFIVITGEIGAGKTTIVRSLFEQLDRSQLVAAQLVSTQLDADDMLRAVAMAFGLPVRTLDKASLLTSLEAFLCQLAVDKKRALLVVDEAQNLTPRAIEELRMLSNFQLGDQALLQSFLIGQPELRTMMQGTQMQQLRQRVIASYHLGPLDKSETQAYIEHRLAHVGWKGDPRFSSPLRSISSIATRRHSAAHQHALQSPDARRISRREACVRRRPTCRGSRTRSARSSVPDPKPRWHRPRPAARGVASGPVARIDDAGAVARATPRHRGAPRSSRKDALASPSTSCTGCCIRTASRSRAARQAADGRNPAPAGSARCASSAHARTT